MRRVWSSSTTAIAIASGIAAAVGSAPSAGAEQIQETVVTAQRRAENLQEVAASISAVDEETIQLARIEGPLDLARIAPSLNISTSFGATQLNIRGLGYEASNASSEASVLAFVDGVYIARPTSLDAIFGDLERIEVLRGPQGTLYGRNATGGVINFISRLPGDAFKADLAVTYGESDRAKVTGSVEGAVLDSTSARLYVFHDSYDGDQTDIGTQRNLRDQDHNGLRGTVVTDWTDGFRTILRADWARATTNGPTYDGIEGSSGTGANAISATTQDPDGILNNAPGILPALRNPNDGENLRMNALPRMERKNWGGSLTADLDLFEGVTLRSISALRRAEFERKTQDYDGTTAPMIQENFGVENSRAFTQELTLTGATEGGINWVVGGYYFDEFLRVKYDYDILLGQLFGLTSHYYTDVTAETQSVSVFGQITVPVTDRINITAGVRQNYDDKTQETDWTLFGGVICNNQRVSGNWSDLTWKGGIDFEIADDNMVYATVSKGFKAGGLNLASCSLPYDPEKVISYEVGSKNQFADGRVQVNASAFYYDYTDLQVNVFTATTANTENAAQAKIYGAELEVLALPMDGLTVSANYSWNHSEYEDYLSLNPLHVGLPDAEPSDLSGQRLAHTPRTTASGSIMYEMPIDTALLNLRYDVRYNSGWYGDAFNENFGTKQKAYTLQNARVGLKFESFEIGAFVDNLADKVYAENRFTFGTGANVLASWGARRTWGVFFNTSFGD